MFFLASERTVVFSVSDAVLPGCSTSGKRREREREREREGHAVVGGRGEGREGVGVINNCTPLSDAGISV